MADYVRCQCGGLCQVEVLFTVKVFYKSQINQPAGQSAGQSLLRRWPPPPKNVVDGSSMIGFPLVIADSQQDMPGMEPGLLG